eukprot:3431482-Pleurochrysis_carterae.AAC.2
MDRAAPERLGFCNAFADDEGAGAESSHMQMDNSILCYKHQFVAVMLCSEKWTTRDHSGTAR